MHSLPDDVLICVFASFSGQDLLNVRSVCLRWHRLVQQHVSATPIVPPSMHNVKTYSSLANAFHSLDPLTLCVDGINPHPDLSILPVSTRRLHVIDISKRCPSSFPSHLLQTLAMLPTQTNDARFWSVCFPPPPRNSPILALTTIHSLALVNCGVPLDVLCDVLAILPALGLLQYHTGYRAEKPSLTAQHTLKLRLSQLSALWQLDLVMFGDLEPYTFPALPSLLSLSLESTLPTAFEMPLALRCLRLPGFWLDENPSLLQPLQHTLTKLLVCMNEPSLTCFQSLGALSQLEVLELSPINGDVDPTWLSVLPDTLTHLELGLETCHAAHLGVLARYSNLVWLALTAQVTEDNVLPLATVSTLHTLQLMDGALDKTLCDLIPALALALPQLNTLIVLTATGSYLSECEVDWPTSLSVEIVTDPCYMMPVWEDTGIDSSWAVKTVKRALDIMGGEERGQFNVM